MIVDFLTGLDPMAGALLILAVGAVLGGAVYLLLRPSDEDDEPFPAPDADGELPDEVELDPPTMRGSRWGMAGEVYKTWRYLVKTEKLAGRGYVRWYCIDDTFPKPKFIKPTDEGAGIPEYEQGDSIYLFPKKARKPSAENGMWTYIHQKGDPEPINVIDYRETVFTSEQAKEWMTQVVTADRPSSGMFDFLTDLDAEDALPIAIGIVVVLAVLMNGGI